MLGRVSVLRPNQTPCDEADQLVTVSTTDDQAIQLPLVVHSHSFCAVTHAASFPASASISNYCWTAWTAAAENGRGLCTNCAQQRVGYMLWAVCVNTAFSATFCGGEYRNRTGVDGFAIRCVTTPPTRRRWCWRAFAPFAVFVQAALLIEMSVVPPRPISAAMSCSTGSLEWLKPGGEYRIRTGDGIRFCKPLRSTTPPTRLRGV